MNRREAVGRGCFVLYLKRILKGLLVLATIVCVLTLAWQYVYYPDNYDANRVSGFYQEPEESLDVVLIGASDIGRAYCAGLAYRDYGIRSYPFVINGDDVHVWKYQLSEVLAHQKPDKIVIEVNGALYSQEEEKKFHMYESAVSRLSETMPWSPRKLRMVQEYLRSSGNYGNALSLYWPLYANHADWPGGVLSVFYRIQMNRTKYDFNGGVSTLRGFETLTGQKPIGPQQEIPSSYEEALDPEYERALREFLSCCRKKGMTNILFIRAPHCLAAGDERAKLMYGRSNRIGSIIEEYGYPYINFENHKDLPGIETPGDFYDSQHLKVSGMQKFTAYFSGYLLENGVNPKARKISPRREQQWRRTVDYTERFLRRYDELCRDGQQDTDLYESPELLETLQGGQYAGKTNAQ